MFWTNWPSLSVLIVAIKKKVEHYRRVADSFSHTDGKLEHKVKNQMHMCTLEIMRSNKNPTLDTSVMVPFKQ
jgi:hypothetical protein